MVILSSFFVVEASIILLAYLINILSQEKWIGE